MRKKNHILPPSTTITVRDVTKYNQYMMIMTYQKIIISIITIIILLIIL